MTPPAKKSQPKPAKVTVSDVMRIQIEETGKVWDPSRGRYLTKEDI